MAITSDSDSTAWISLGVIATDTVVQCRRGTALVSWGTPDSIDDGMRLEIGQSVIVPSGVTLQWRPQSEITTEIFWRPFGV